MVLLMKMLQPVTVMAMDTMSLKVIKADDNAAIHPGATEVYYDGVDQNCDGMSDFDQDGDGSDSANFGGADCNDLNPSLEVIRFGW